jgi:hypothetical protein
MGEEQGGHWKISVVQSPPWSRTSWARAGPPGRSWKSTKKSRSISMPPYAEALLVYDRLRVLLRDELGIAPSPAVQSVHRRLLGETTRTSA